MATKFSVRDATRDDCQAIVDLITELAVYEKEEPTRVQITKETLVNDGFGKQQWFQCLVGEIQRDGSASSNQNSKTAELIGYALFFPTYSTWNGRTMKIEDLYIKPAYRGNGYGSALLKEVTQLSLERHCVRVHWCVLDWNKPAIDYYKHIGAEYLPQWRQCTLHLTGMKEFVEK